MDIQLKKWGNSLGLKIPQKLAASLGLDETSLVEIFEAEEGIIIRKKIHPANLKELLASIPSDFEYPDDIEDFVDGSAMGQEIL